MEWVRGSGLGVGGRFETHSGPGRDLCAAVLFDAFDQRLGPVAEAKGGLERVAFLEVAEREVVLHLFGDAVHAVFDCDVFHVVVSAV